VSEDPSLLIGGGWLDPNLDGIIASASERGISIIDCRHCADAEPSVEWDMVQGTLYINGEEANPTAAFLRWNVFGPEGFTRPTARDGAWHTLLTSLCLARPQVAFLNRYLSQSSALRALTLIEAGRCGLVVPKTSISNLVESKWRQSSNLIAKPIEGGAHTRLLADCLTDGSIEPMPSPAIIQSRLTYPEYRIYLVGKRVFAYAIMSQHIDWRIGEADNVSFVHQRDLPIVTLNALILLASTLGADFSASDFKTCPESGEMVFLEMNTMPMFDGFDKLSGGRLSTAIVEELCLRPKA
jgi:hypothetical protein